MSETSRKPAWPWIVALLIGLPVLYVLSFGPACWASLRTRSGGRLIGTIYYPIFWSAIEQDVGRSAAFLYMTAGAPAGVHPVTELSGGKYVLRRNPP